jgi:hypothetical protein
LASSHPAISIALGANNTMPGIEYCPNNRSSCKGCYSKIQNGEVRVNALLAASGRGDKMKKYHRAGRGDMMRKYHHADCYSSRKDFTKFYGWDRLKLQDKLTYTTPKQLKDYHKEQAAVAQAAVVDEFG